MKYLIVQLLVNALETLTLAIFIYPSFCHPVLFKCTEQKDYVMITYNMKKI